MATQQDCSIGFGVESTFKTGVTPTRWVEFIDESLDWKKGTKQGQGLRVGSRVARSGRRVNPTADGGGDVSIECASKGLGLIWQWLLGGTSTSNLVSGTTFQQVHILGESASSMTIQKGIVEAGGTVDPYTFLGNMPESFEFDFPNGDIATLKFTDDAADLTTATAYTSPSYAAEPVNLFHFANGSISTGALTAPTTTVMGSGATPTANIRGGTIQVSNSLMTDRQNFGAGGRKAKQLRGLRVITGTLQIEYDSTGYRDMVINDTPMNLIVNFTGGALSTGTEQLQVIVPEIKFDSELPKANGTDLVVQSMAFTGLDNLTAAQPLWVTCRTADAAL